ncbi:hypothetical protein [Salipiger mangrovisoli]|uniref:Uncharacterized protein n=1 Tax=Salipiger mangrovisoli TaxID=2865933 RepID=A0ABR9X3Z7_9RHOB|nr:hypothetical protein [Salipiger mangrovisoli]MBE9638305.1 hypothetical protein [Salipiger mangrovisoli]
MLTRRTFLASALAAPCLAAPAAADLLKVRDLYQVKGRGLSDLAQQSVGQRLEIEGFMAPPLKAESRFFVLTKMPMAVCPFCETEAEWPNDIIAVYTKRIVDVTPFNVKITTSGVLEVGAYTDPDTGFVSLLRLVDATYG